MAHSDVMSREELAAVCELVTNTADDHREMIEQWLERRAEPMSPDVFKAVLELFIEADKWPTANEDARILMEGWLDRCAQARGHRDLVAAWHAHWPPRKKVAR